MPSNDEELTASVLGSHKVDVLREMCRDRGLSPSGRKSDLIQRLVQHQQTRIDPSQARIPTPTDNVIIHTNDKAKESRVPPPISSAHLDTELAIEIPPDVSRRSPRSNMPIASPIVNDVTEGLPVVKKEVVSDEASQSSSHPFTAAFVCHSNMNRSMEAHHLCAQADLFDNRGSNMYSFGAGGRINLPGTTINSPFIFDFGPTKYSDIHSQLAEADLGQYTRNGVLKMLERNMSVKMGPERWQDVPMHFNVIICYEQRIFDIVLEDLAARPNKMHRLAHVVNIETVDNFTAAKVGASLSLTLIQKIKESSNWENDILTILAELEAEASIQNAVVFY